MNNKDCMFGSCKYCKSNIYKMYTDNTKRTSDEEIMFHEWTKKTETRKRENGQIRVKVTNQAEIT